MHLSKCTFGWSICILNGLIAFLMGFGFICIIFWVIQVFVPSFLKLLKLEKMIISQILYNFAPKMFTTIYQLFFMWF